MKEPRAYAVYWSIYTDLRGRRQFRELYWDRLKDLIGRPASLVGIEREDQWPSGLPSHELRCHVWTYFRAHRQADAIAHALRAAMRIAPDWHLMFSPTLGDDDSRSDVFELLWNRKPEQVEAGLLPLPRLTSIMMGLRRDIGFRIRQGFTIANGGEGERPHKTSTISPSTERANYSVIWRLQVQTSTKRALMETHWPKLRARFGEEDAELLDIEKRSGDVGPFKLMIRQTMRSVNECEFLVTVLSQCTGMNFSMNVREDGGLDTLRAVSFHTNVRDAHHILGVEMERLC